MLPCSVICFLALVFWYNPSMAVASKSIYLLEGVFIVTPVFMPTLFLLHYSGEKIKNSPLFWLVTAVLGVFFIIQAAAQFTDAFYYVTPDNQFFRGPLWAFWVTPLAVNNIKQRLELMCNGKLTITQRKSGGISVRVMIPRTDK